MDLREVGYDGRDWINLAQDRAGLCEGGNEPPGSLKANKKEHLFFLEHPFACFVASDGPPLRKKGPTHKNTSHILPAASVEVSFQENKAFSRRSSAPVATPGVSLPVSVHKYLGQTRQKHVFPARSATRSQNFSHIKFICGKKILLRNNMWLKTATKLQFSVQQDVENVQVKPRRLSISNKVNVIQRLENGTDIKNIAGEFKARTAKTSTELSRITDAFSTGIREKVANKEEWPSLQKRETEYVLQRSGAKDESICLPLLWLNNGRLDIISGFWKLDHRSWKKVPFRSLPKISLPQTTAAGMGVSFLHTLASAPSDPSGRASSVDLWRTEEKTSDVLCMECSIVWGETWTLRRSEEKRLEAFEMWIWRRMESVKWTDNKK
ncbi:hypothetical protein ANN_02583 [Periplaneta americana]|uniref:HTH psq-type domain-containing protein n=1 Tax=Periplaneta americana TaxID=6978 RepID=A0ABQ8TZN2_PERAM|nr:hypothetical protein ANN_02583 [Periplaneta americana]